MSSQTNNPTQVYQSAKPLDPSEDPSKELKRQCCGYTTAIFILLAVIGLIRQQIEHMIQTEFQQVKIFYGIQAVAHFFAAIYFVSILYNPKNVAGKPAHSTFWSLYLSIVIKFVACVYMAVSGLPIGGVVVNIVAETMLVIMLIFIYGADDETKPCCLWFKPWVYQTKVIPLAASYPPFGYPPQSYPPQGYPPQMPGSYPVPGAYPPQAYQQAPTANENPAQVQQNSQNLPTV